MKRIVLILFFSTSLLFGQWLNVGSGTNNSSHGMCLWDGKLVDVGSFNNPCNRVAVWNDTNFICLGSGVGIVGRAAIEYNGDLIVCGDFWNVHQPCVGCNGIARWDGTSWQPLGTGFNNDVLCLTIWQGDLIAAGDFTQADGNACSRIARWNGTTWLPFGGPSDFDNDIRCMVEYDGDLWVGGDFNNVAGCTACDGLVKWDGTQWLGGNSGVDINGGLDSTVRVLYVDQVNDLLYMGGHFQGFTCNGVYNPNLNGVAVYDGSEWTALGTGVNSYVRAITKYNNSIIVGGDFNLAGGITANKVARWNLGTTSWSAMGTGMNDYVKSAEVYNGYLYVGGPFTTADGLTRNCIARWYEAPTSPPVADIGASTTTTCAGQCINFTDYSSNSPTSWTWSFPGGTPSSSTSANPGTVCYATVGSYNVTLTACNASGCNTTTQTITVTNSPTVTVNNLSICQGQSGTLTATGAVDYSWSPSTGLSAAIGSPLTANPTITTTYTVTGTSSAGCSGTAVATVTVNPLPTQTASNAGPYCTGQNIQLNATAGATDYDWTGPGGYVQNNTHNPIRTGATLAMAGVYTVTLTNSFGCTSTSTTTVVVNPIPTNTVSNTGPYCVNNTIQLNATSGASDYDWTGPNSYVQNNTQNPTISSATTLMAGVYTCTITNASGCTSSATTTVVVNSLPTQTASNTGPFCTGQTIQLNATSGAADYDWTGPNSYVQNNTQNPTIPGASFLMAGIYTVTITNAAGCSVTSTTMVSINASPTNTVSNTGPYCEGNTIALNATSGAADYDWTGPNSYVQNNTEDPVIASSTAAMAGVYTCTISNASGCSVTATTTVVVNTAPTQTASNTGPYCVGATIQLNATSGATDYDWTGPLGFNQPNTQNPNIGSASTAHSGIYTVTITNASGCSNTSTTTVIVNTTPTAFADNDGDYCEGDTIHLTSSGGATFNWTGPGTFSSSNQNPEILSANISMSGTYTVTATLVGGCSATATTTLNVNPIPTNTISNSGPYCEGETIQLLATSGAADYDWLGPNAYVQNDMQNASITSSTSLMSGAYTCTITNGFGCSISTTTNVVVNPLPDVTTSVAGITITANASGLNYQWVDCDNGFAEISGETSQTFTATSNGNYAVIINDNGCIDTSACVNISNVGLDESDVMSISITPNPATDYISITIENEGTLKMYDISGKVISIRNLSNGTHSIDVGELRSGMYILELSSNNQVGFTRMIKK